MKQATLIYDGDCGFCEYWVQRWKKTTGDEVEYKAYQQSLSEFENLSKEECESAVQLITSGGEKFSAAEAVFETLAIGGNTKWKWVYNNIPFVSYLFEFSYKIIAHNRSFFFKLTKIFFDEND